MTDKEIIEKIHNFLVEEFEVEAEKLIPEANLKETLELDSLDYIDLVVVIEKNFAFKVKPEDFMGIVTTAGFLRLCNIPGKFKRTGIMSLWQGKSKGTTLGYRIFVWVLKNFGVLPAYFLLRFVVLYYFLFSFKSSRQIYSLYHRKLGYSRFSSVIKFIKTTIFLARASLIR